MTISADTNLFIYAANKADPFHEAAKDFLQSQQRNPEFFLSELVLIEIYIVLRNTKVFRQETSAQQASQYCQQLARNPFWHIVGLPDGVTAKLWEYASQKNFSIRRIIDLRLGFSLRWHGVTDFATTNVKDFKECGFAKLWNPCLPQSA